MLISIQHPSFFYFNKYLLDFFSADVIRTMNRFCSPANENKKNCLSDKALKKLVTIWNSFHTNKINLKTCSGNNAYKCLNNKLKPHCGSDKYWLWCDVMEILASKMPRIDINKIAKIKRDLRVIAKKELKPEKPMIWYKKPKTWLSNFDIQNVMVQYEQTKKYKYVFLGVFPIDFSVIAQGRCVHSNFCLIDIQRYAKMNKRFIGLITNLDKHDEPGSHWTSTFLVIDPKLQTYGAYYYDSTGKSMPSYLVNFLNNVKTQCESLYPERPFSIFQNKKQHQYKNSECGMFSMVFQIRWINKHIVKKNNTSFEEIVANPFINDDKMLEIRDTLFRPNNKIELKKLKLI